MQQVFLYTAFSPLKTLAIGFINITEHSCDCSVFFSSIWFEKSCACQEIVCRYLNATKYSELDSTSITDPM